MVAEQVWDEKTGSRILNAPSILSKSPLLSLILCVPH